MKRRDLLKRYNQLKIVYVAAMLFLSIRVQASVIMSPGSNIQEGYLQSPGANLDESIMPDGRQQDQNVAIKQPKIAALSKVSSDTSSNITDKNNSEIVYALIKKPKNHLGGSAHQGHFLKQFFGKNY
jgi:hypothetical protein